MDPITGFVANKAIQAVTDLAGKITGSGDSKDSKKTEKDSSFEGLLRSALVPDKENNVNEEELFAAVVMGRIQALKGDEGVAKYEEALATQKAAHQGSDGYCWLEDAVGGALNDLKASGVLSDEEAKKIYSESFAAAQLDGNKDALYDGKGGANDPTKAVNEMEAALMSAKLMIEQIDKGEVKVDAVEVGSKSNSGSAGGAAGSTATGATVIGNAESGSVTPQGTTVDGANNFLFKPISENEGTLAVLMPSDLVHQVDSLVIKDAEGNVIEEGHSTGYGDNGEREKFAFSKPGGSYSSNLTVEARLSNGAVKTWLIPNPSLRYD